MSKIVDEAMDAVRKLSAVEQADIGREIRARTLEAQGATRVTGGYAFRVPSAWMFGRADEYLVSDTQIDAISDRRHTKSDMVVAVAASALAVAAVYGLPAILLPFDFFAGQTIGHVCFWIAQCWLTLLAYVQACRWLARRRLQPLLAGLPRTAD